MFQFDCIIFTEWIWSSVLFFSLVILLSPGYLHQFFSGIHHSAAFTQFHVLCKVVSIHYLIYSSKQLYQN